MGGGHGLGRRVQQYLGFAGGQSSVEDGLNECAADAVPPGFGADPEALELPRGGQVGRGLGGRQRTPGYEACPFSIDSGYHRSAGMIEKAVGQRGGFLFQRAVAKGGYWGLIGDEFAVFQEQLFGGEND